MKIIITGSLGNIGKPLTEELVQQGHAVTVISSSTGKQKDIEAFGAKAAIGSLDDTDFVTATFTGTDAAFVMVPPNFKAPDVHEYYKSIGRVYAKAIQNSGIKRIVHLSSYGAHMEKDSGFILGSHFVEGILNDVPGIALTHLRPGYFYYNLLAYTGMIKHAGFIASNFGDDDKIVMVHPTDIATAAAEELVKPTSTAIRYVVSDEKTANQAAKILGAAIGRPDLQWRTISNEEAQRGMEEKGLPAHIATLFTDLGASLHNGKLLEEYEKEAPPVMGKVKLEDFAKEFAKAF